MWNIPIVELSILLNMKIYSFNRQSALLLFIYFHSLFNFVLIFLNWIFGKGENLEWALRNVFNLCNSWVTAWSSVYGDTECVYPRDRISLQQQQRLSASPRLLAAPPQPRGQCDWKLHTVIILSFFLLLQRFCVCRLIKQLKRQNCSHIFEVDT